MTALRVDDLRKAFQGVRAVDGVSFAVGAGELVALIGPNGAGKSTCFNLINGQLRADGGTVRVQGRDVLGMAPRDIWRLGVGRTFQITATFGSMTVCENVQTALIAHHRRLMSPWVPARTLYRQEALGLLQRVDMADRADQPCATLAYGDLKRVDLAVALANSPRLLLMDEPTAGMAPAERSALMRLTTDLARATNAAILFTEHDMDVVFGHADRIVVLHAGKVIADGPPETVRNDARVREVYLGNTAGGGR